MLSHVFPSAGATYHLPPASIAVGLFFVMSGYVLTPSWNGDYAAFLVRRFLRLWPVYAACLAAGSLILGVRLAWTDFAFYPIFPPVAAVHADLPVWSLHIEMWAMLAMPFIVWSGKSLPRTVIGALVFAVLGQYEMRFANGALFVLGSYLSRYHFDFAPLNGRVAQWLGRISYSLYLTHWIVLKACALWFPAAVYVEIPIAFVVSYLVCVTIERASISLSRQASKTIRNLRLQVPALRAA
jgi:peptidoglycan/LPS O-acetylase OafA/YrhL